MISALEARKSSQVSVEQSAIKLRAKIERSISQAIDAGEFFTEIDGDMPWSITEQLIVLGYEVHHNFDEFGEFTSIRW